ncbi:MAG TPA: DUF1571 domain-containing protein [Candidatus Methylomirabilis sp.]|nr:DUF1571 domain-containing protein [Candidatus Methylomirabilis sp.]
MEFAVTRSSAVLCLLVLAILWAVPRQVAGANGADLLRLLDLAEKSYAGVQDYTSIMLGRERIGGVLRPQETILLKFQRPFKVYMKWLEGPSKGREGLYVSGAREGKFLLYEPRGIRRLFTAALDPSDQRIMEQSRHPVTDVGIGRLLEIVGENARRGTKNGVLQVTDRGIAELAGRRVRTLEGMLPRDPKLAYYCYRVILSFDEENHLPIRVAVYDWDDQMVEEYIHTALQVNPGFTGRDFDPANGDYGFSGWRINISG